MANNSYKDSILLGVRLQPTNEIQNELNDVIKQLEKNSNINLKIDTKSINQSLKDFSNTLNDISNKIKNDFNFQGAFSTQASSINNITNKLKEEQQAIEQTSNTMKTLSNTTIGKADSNGNITEVLKTVEQLQKGIGNTTRLTTDLKTGLTTASNTENFQKLNNIIDNLQNKLSKSSNNKFINESVISELQNRLNGINTNTAEKEIKELQTTINNLSSSDSQIVRLQNVISKMENNLTNMKGKYGSLVGDSSSKAQLDSYTSQVEKLKNTLKDLQNGGTINGQKLASELNLGTNASRELSTAVKNSASALKLATTDSESFGQSIRRALSNTGIYMGTYQVINTITNALKDGIKTIIDIDTQMRDLAKVSSATTEQLSKFSGVANKIAIDVGTSTEAVISATTYYSKLGYSIDEASKRAEKATIFANVADMNIDDASKALITIQKGFNLNSLEDMNRVMDVANAIGNNYSSTSQNVAEGLRRMGNAMKEAGNSYEQSVGLFVAGNASVQDAEVVGNAIKTITMRLRGMKTEIDDTGIPASKLRQAIKDITATTGQEIDIMKDNNTYKSTYDQMTELAKVYPKLSDAQRSYLQYVIAGQRQGNIFSGMMANMKEGTEAYTTALNSSGSAMREQQIFMDSIEGKLNKLKETFKQFWVATISSSSVKNTVDALTKLVSTFGNLPTIIALATTAFLVFKGQAIMGAIGGLIQYATTLTAVISRVGLTKVAMGELSIAMSTNPFGLLAVGITTAIVALDLFGTSSEQAKQKNEELLSSIKQSKDDIASLEQLKTQFENLNNELNSGNLTTEEAKQKKQELSGVYQKLIQQAPELQGLLNGETGSYQNQSKAIQNIIDLKKQEMALKSEKYFDDNNVSDKSLQQKIDQMKQYQKMMESNAKYATMSDEELKNNNALGWSSGDTVREQNKHSELLNKQKLMDLNQELQTIMTNYNTLNSLGLKSPISNDMIQKIKEISSSLNVYGNDIKNNTNKINENTDAKDKNNQVLSTSDQEAQAEQQKTQAVSKATEEYQKSTQAIAKAQGFIDKLNKSQAVTPQIAGQISKTYGDITTQINSYGSTIDFLKNKIKEQQEAQENALMIMKGDDADFYKEKIANSDSYENQINDFLARFTGNSQQAYNVDLSQFTTLNQMKAGVQGTLKSAVDNFLSQFVDTNSSAYQVDYSNFTSLMTAKSELLKQMAGSMASFWDETAQAFNGQAFGGMDLSGHSSDSMYEAYQQKAQGILDLGSKIKGAMGKLDGIYAGGGLNFQGFSGGGDGGTSDFSGTGGSGGKSKAESEAEKAQKMAEDIQRLKSEIEPDRYLDFNNAIKQVDNELTLNKSIRDTLKKDSPEYQNSLKKDIDYYKEKQVALNNLNNEQKKEQEELKTKLANLGFEFDSNNKLINSQQKLLSLQEQVNSMGGNTEQDKQAKEDAIKNLKDINDETKKYIELVGDKIPKTTEEWEEQANAIAKVKDEMKESLANFRDKIAGYELEKLKKQAEDAETIAENAYKKNKQSLEDRKKEEIDDLESQIKSLEAQKKALEDDTDNNQDKLKKLKAERDLWSKELNNVFAKSKIADLDKSIKETETAIKKADLDKQIEDLQTQKDTKSTKYDKDIQDLENSYNEEKEIQKKKNDDSILEEKAYEKADKLLKGNHQKEIIELIKSYGQSYKDVGTLLGQNFKDAWIEQIKQAKEEYESLMKDIKDVKSNDKIDKDSSDVYVAKDSGGIPEADTAEQKSHASNSSSSSNSSNANKQYANGDYTDSNGYYYTNSGDTYYDAASGKYKKYASGTDNAQAGYAEVAEDGFEILIGRQVKKLKGGETILNNSTSKNLINALGESSNNETSQINDIYDFVKSSGSLINQLAQSYSNSSNYSIPNLSINDLNKIANSVINNDNSSNNISTPVEMSVSIINQNGAEAIMNEKTLEKMVTKVVQKNATKYGGKGFTNR